MMAKHLRQCFAAIYDVYFGKGSLWLKVLNRCCGRHSIHTSQSASVRRCANTKVTEYIKRGNSTPFIQYSFIIRISLSIYHSSPTNQVYSTAHFQRPDQIINTIMQFTSLLLCVIVTLAASSAALPSPIGSVSSPLLTVRQQSCGDCEMQLENGEDACDWGICQGCGLC
jgi:hypothetical protein